MQSQNTFNIYQLSEQAITIEFGRHISKYTLQQISNFNRLLHQKPPPGFITTVTAYTTVTLFYDPVLVIKSTALPGTGCFTKLFAYIDTLKIEVETAEIPPGKTITIPVCYGGDFGPDLDELADLHQLTPQQVIQLHTSVTYPVYMIGFVPGFAYLGGMPDELETPRKPTPRKAIAAGSIGIAGKQTGIYPLETPGGWQIIGKTPLKLFDAERVQPSLLSAGDEVIFEAIDITEFNRLSKL